MSPIAILFGVLLILLGGGLYYETGARTSLIPSYFGIALVILGIVARSDKLRKHAMHVAALLGLVGFAMPAFMVFKALVIDEKAFVATSMGGQLAMSALCLVFLGLCVKSFIDVRRKRKAAEGASKEPTR